MSKRDLTEQEELLLWRELGRRTALLDSEPAVSSDRVDRVLEQLPQRRAGEDVGSRIRRTGTAARPTHSNNVSTLPQRHPRFMPLTEIVRLAASTAATDLPLPDPGRALESTDGRFRLKIDLQHGIIVILVQALGLAADEFADQCIGLAGSEDDEPVVTVRLDADGDGEARVEDSALVRRVLLRPIIGVMQDE